MLMLRDFVEDYIQSMELRQALKHSPNDGCDFSRLKGCIQAFTSEGFLRALGESRFRISTYSVSNYLANVTHRSTFT